MLTEKQFAEQQCSLGRRIHLHDGVWWEEVHPFYCKPAFIFRAFDPGEARPAHSRSWLGFSHQARTPGLGNRMLQFMVLEGNNLRGFDIMKIQVKKRNQVRKALRSCEVKIIPDIEPYIERMREINIAQALRQEQRAGAETPSRRYTKEADAWRQQIRREFLLEGREWWGAFVGGELAAYLRTYQVDGTRVIVQTKVDPSFFKDYPMDALYFIVLARAGADPVCQRVINGRPMHPSLNHYKEQFLFECRGLPYYSNRAWLVEMAKRVVLRT